MLCNFLYISSRLGRFPKQTIVSVGNIQFNNAILTFVEVLEPAKATDPAMFPSVLLVDMVGLNGCDY